MREGPRQAARDLGPASSEVRARGEALVARAAVGHDTGGGIEEQPLERVQSRPLVETEGARLCRRGSTGVTVRTLVELVSAWKPR